MLMQKITDIHYLVLCSMAVILSLMIADRSVANELKSCVTDSGHYFGLAEEIEEPRYLVPDSMLPLEVSPATGFRHVRHQFRVVEAPVQGWQITFRDEALRVLATVTQDDISATGLFWTPRLPPETVIDSPPSNAGAVLLHQVRAVRMPSDSSTTTFYSIFNAEPKWQQLHGDVPSGQGVTLNRMRQARRGDSVAIIEVWRASFLSTCTGVALSPNYVLTNWHCGAFFTNTADPSSLNPAGFWSREVCESTRVDFSWDNDSLPSEFGCQWPVNPQEEEIEWRAAIMDEDLDYALFRFGLPNAKSRIRPVRIAPVGNEVSNDAPITVIHHPRGEPKSVTASCRTGQRTQISTWRTGKIPGARFEHFCDTIEGSSGAPIFDAHGLMIGLHHHGFDRDLDTCNVLPDGKSNKAIHLHMILADIAKKAPHIAQEIEAHQAELGAH